MIESRARLEGYLRHRLARTGDDLAGDSKAAVLLRSLAGSLIASGSPDMWVRRPSISDDGWPVVLSLKAGIGRDQSIRVLIESGSLRMSVAEQIAHSLMRLDEILGLLDWRDASQDINSLTRQVLPVDPADTVAWLGGMWLGAEVDPEASEPELRLYFNLRYGGASERWQRLCRLVRGFSSDSIHPHLCEWEERSAPHARPVGLGVVVVGGLVRGIRAYLGVESPTPESLTILSAGISRSGESAMRSAVESFSTRFGPITRQGVTMGFDFVRGGTCAKRVKADLCCHLVQPDLRPCLVPWIESLFVDWGYHPADLNEFLTTIQEFWPRSEVQFLSLGFSPELEHATVYVKPCA